MATVSSAMAALQMTNRTKFARLLGTPYRTMMAWCRGESEPPPATRRLFALITRGVVTREHLESL